MHKNLPPADELPWTISYVIRKRMQIDSFSELPEEKRPPDTMIWYGSQEEIDDWLKKVFGKNPPQTTINVEISEDEIG